MGRGGEAGTAPQSSVGPQKSYKLDGLDTAELRKWATKYNEDSNAERATLLAKLNPYADGIMDKTRPEVAPIAPLPFKLSDVRNAIPKHCFERNLFNSLYYLAIDLTLIAIMGYLATYIGTDSVITIPQNPYFNASFTLPAGSEYILWPLYIVAQGCVMTGVWVLAHECGHQSFSASEFWNNFFGTILHSALLVPYHSWRITHGKHHNNTGSCENDEVFAPSRLEDWKDDALRETPFSQAWGIFLMLTVGWMPGYLVFNATGPAKYRGKNANHFSPTAVFFEEKDYWLIVQSDIAFFTACGALAYAIYEFGIANVGMFYLLPLVVTNHNLVLITYLQHTASYIPHFRGEEWNFLRGAVCTVDRSFGPLLNMVFHHITDTHVCHHIFSKMPFYHAQEATECIKKCIGKYYLKDDTSIPVALWKSFSECQYVDDEGPGQKNIVFFKNMRE